MKAYRIAMLFEEGDPTEPTGFLFHALHKADRSSLPSHSAFIVVYLGALHAFGDKDRNIA